MRICLYIVGDYNIFLVPDYQHFPKRVYNSETGYCAADPSISRITKVGNQQPKKGSMINADQSAHTRQVKSP